MLNNKVISGHAPGYLRDRFSELLEAEEGEPSAELIALAGRLWNCTDVAPDWVCSLLDEPRSSYAQLARLIRSAE
jgi:hypothetical protein